MPAYFCTQTNVRITAPGVSKHVDPVNGHDECIETAEGKIVLVEDLLTAPPEPPKAPAALRLPVVPTADAAPKSKTTK